MKNKIILSLFTIVIISLIAGAFVFTNTSIFGKISDNSEKILTGQKIYSADKAYFEISSIEKNTNYNNGVDLISKILIKYNLNALTNTKVDVNNLKIKQYNNVIDSRRETVIYNDNFRMKIDSDTGDLLNYINLKKSFLENKLTKNEIQNQALTIFSSININNSNQYELSYIEQFDNEIWRVGFIKKEENLINNYESIKFSFAPQTNEIVTLAINHIQYADNEVLISKENADKIANEYLEKSLATGILSTDIEIVRPNYFFQPNDTYGSVYVNVNQVRKAYVYHFNNEAKSKIYIDCTTGEVIGGDIKLGGNF